MCVGNASEAPIVVLPLTRDRMPAQRVNDVFACVLCQVAAAKAHLLREPTMAAYERIDEIPFSSSRKVSLPPHSQPSARLPACALTHALAIVADDGDCAPRARWPLWQHSGWQSALVDCCEA